jgi:hypothetical protein
MWIPRMLIVLVVVVGAIAVVSAELSDEYSIDIDGSMDIPDQTVETDFGEATISEIGKEEARNFLGVSTDAPENETYRIQIIERDGNNNLLLESERIDGGDTQTEFYLDPGDSLDEPGTYIVTTVPVEGNEPKSIEPFIIKGYSVNQRTSDVTKGTSISVTVELLEINSQADSPQAVNVTLTGNGESQSTVAQEVGELQYRATFETDSLPTGEYQVYSGVENGDSIYGYDELIGLSSSETVEVQSQSTDTPTPTPTATETSTPTPTTPPATESEDSEEEVAGGGFEANKSSTSTTPTAEPELTGQTAPTERASDGPDNDGVVSATRAAAQDSLTPTQSQSKSPAQTEAVDTTATGTPIMPHLAGLLLLSTLLLFTRRLRT